MTYADQDDICYDCSDIVPDNISVFSQILNDDDKMKVNFLNFLYNIPF